MINRHQTAVHKRPIFPYDAGWRPEDHYGTEYKHAMTAYYSGNGDGQGAALRDRIILEHLPQVRLIAKRIHDTLPLNAVPLGDLIGTGTVGLIKAVDGYGPSLNVQLKTYAEYKIRGAIQDFLREADYLSRYARRDAKRFEYASEKFFQRYGRYPDENEAAEMLGVPVESVRRAARDADCRVYSLSVQPGNDNPSRRSYKTHDRQMPDSTRRSSFDEACGSEMLELLGEKLMELPKRKRRILKMYYDKEMTLRKISRKFVISEGRVSQLHNEALSEMRDSFATDGIRSNDGSREPGYAPARKNKPSSGNGSDWRHKRKEITDPEMLEMAESLEGDERAVFFLYNNDGSGMSYRQIAQEVGRSEFYVRTRYISALSRLNAGLPVMGKADGGAPECASASEEKPPSGKGACDEGEGILTRAYLKE